MEDRTLNLTHILYTVCKKWRLLLVVTLIAVIVGVAFSCTMYYAGPTADEKREKKISTLSKEMTSREMEQIQQALWQASEYAKQRNAIQEYIANSYALKDHGDDIPQNRFRFYFDDAIVPIYQYRYRVENAPHVENQYRFLVERAMVPVNEYLFFVERARKPVMQFRFNVDNHFVSSMEQMTRDNLTDITSSVAQGLSDINVAQDVLHLIEAQVNEDEIRRYVGAYQETDSVVVITVNCQDITEEMEQKIQAYLEKKIAELTQTMKAVYGDFDVYFAGTKSDLVEDPLQTRLENAVRGLINEMQDHATVKAIAGILNIEDIEEFEKCFTVQAEGDSFLHIKLSNYDLDEQHSQILEETLAQYVQAAVLESEKNGDCKITYIGHTMKMDLDQVHTQTDRFLQGLAAGMSDKEMISQIADVVGIQAWYDIAKDISVSADGQYLVIRINDVEVSEDVNKQVISLLQAMVSTVAKAQRTTYGENKITFAGSTRNITNEKEQLLQKNLASIFIPEISGAKVTNEVAAILDIENAKVSQILEPNVDDMNLTVSIVGMNLTGEQSRAIEDLIYQAIETMTIENKSHLGDCVIYDLGKQITNGINPLQPQIQVFANGVMADLIDVTIGTKVAAIIAANEKYISECLSVNFNDGYLEYSIRYLALTDDQIETIAELLQERIDDSLTRQKELGGYFNATYVGTLTEMVINSQGSNTYMTQMRALNDVNDNYRSISAKMGNDQAKLFELLLDKQESVPSEVESKNGPSKKLALIVAFLIVAAVVAWIIARYVFARTFQCSTEFYDLKINVLGVVAKRKDEHRFGMSMDRLLERIFYGRGRNTEDAQKMALEVICAQIIACVREKKMESICIAHNEDEACAGLCTKLTQKIQDQVGNVFVADHILNNGDVIAKIGDCDGIVLVESTHYTEFKAMEDELKIAKLCNAEVIGLVVME